MQWCDGCGCDTTHLGERANHVLHVALAALTVGLWIPVWIIEAWWRHYAPSHCTVCGRENQELR